MEVIICEVGGKGKMGNIVHPAENLSSSCLSSWQGYQLRLNYPILSM